ncbi:hypothetical protein [Caballeronia mineralivorans]|jgi:hypothetical protein|uniref:hypothetical protein n=1 Tax=Caballeronia mineralivorans TaxID=2010198 RepID=UPI002B000550|nr:hypothetical protein [Caballeronia mineralivorans]MEA3102472.1 hypothetical protein [Caballeronia mineralivorans]
MSDSQVVAHKPTPPQSAILKPLPNNRIVILSVSQVSRVGKSTVCATMLLEKLGGKIYSVEGRNQDASQYGVDIEKFQPGELKKLRAAMMLNPGPSIVDVGASRYDEFIKQIVTAQMTKIFDYVVVTTDPSGRAIEETISTFETLRSIGFDMSKVRVVFNRVDPDADVIDQFEALFAYSLDHPDLKLDKTCALPDSQLFEAMRNLGLSWQTALEDKTDYQALVTRLVSDGKNDQALETAERSIASELAVGAKYWIDKAFPSLNIPVTPSKV